MKIEDTPCEFNADCKAPVELLSKKLDAETNDWMGFYTCLNKHYYMKKINIEINQDYYEDVPEGEQYVQEELPFSDETDF